MMGLEEIFGSNSNIINSFSIINRRQVGFALFTNNRCP